MTEEPLKKKVEQLPAPMRQRVGKTAANLRRHSRLTQRLKKLRGISDTEWNEAQDADTASGTDADR